MIPRKLVFPENLSFFLFGPRQSGKSSLIDVVFTKEVWKVDLLLGELFLEYSKSPEIFRRQAETKIEKEGVKTIVVDEVQRVPGLLAEIHYLMGRFQDVRFVLTGSSARKIKRGGADMLAGRAVEKNLFPLTWDELGNTFDLDDALRFGTLPSLCGKNEVEKQQIMSAYVQTYLREEIRAEGIARNLGGFSRFLDVAASQCGEIVNCSSIGRECSLSQKTVESYYEILEDTLIGFRLEPWRKSLRKRLSSHAKFYLFDTGVTNAINRRLTARADPVIRGRLFEQFIVCEIRRAVSYAGSELRTFFWRTSNGAEVDILLEKHGSILAAIEIKSTAGIAGPDCSGLRAFSGEYPGTPLFIACTASNAWDLNGVTVIPWQELMARLKMWL